MGMERIVRFPSGTIPEWSTIAEKLKERGQSPVIRMIDNLPAFPDEVPAEDWRELRLGLTGGMVTLSRMPGVLRCTVWGNAGPDLQASWDDLVKAVLASGNAVEEG